MCCDPGARRQGDILLVSPPTWKRPLLMQIILWKPGRARSETWSWQPMRRTRCTSGSWSPWCISHHKVSTLISRTMLTAFHPSRVPVPWGAAWRLGCPSVRRHYVIVADLAFPQGLLGSSLAYNQTDEMKVPHGRLDPQIKLPAIEK